MFVLFENKKQKISWVIYIILIWANADTQECSVFHDCTVIIAPIIVLTLIFLVITAILRNKKTAL